MSLTRPIVRPILRPVLRSVFDVGVGGGREADPFPQFQSSLEAAGVWQKMDAIYVLGRPTSAGTLVNVRNPGTNDLAAVGTAPAFTAGKGYRSAGSGSFFNAFDPLAGSYNFQQDNHSFGLWCMDDVESNFSAMGWNGYLINPKVATNSFRARSASTSNDNVTGDVDGRGLCVVSRLSSGEFTMYRNGEIRGEKVRSSTADLSGVFRICGWGASGSNHYDGTRSHSFAFIGGGLTATEVMALYQAAGLLLQRINE